MALDKMRNAVLDAAHAEAARVVQVAEKQAAERLAAEKAQAEAASDMQYQAQAAAIEEELARKVVHFKGVANKQLLDKRNARLRSLFDQARKQILSWSTEEYGTVMRRMIQRAAGDGAGRLRVHERDQALFAGLVQELNRTRRPDAQLEIEKEQGLMEPGGFIFVGADFEVDQTLDTVLAAIEHELTPIIAGELFSR